MDPQLFNNIEAGDSILLKEFSLDLVNPVPFHKHLKIGNECMIGSNFVVETPDGEIKIGDRVFLGGGSVSCRTRIEFGNNVFMAWGGCIRDHDLHSLDFRKRQEECRKLLDDFRNGRDAIRGKNWSNIESRGIVIENDVWIGMHCTILKGVTIGEGAIIGAHSVITCDVEPWTVVTGNPGRRIL
jgi:acetyltransferase-like isoleucine patch superfamily enzyme